MPLVVVAVADRPGVAGSGCGGIRLPPGEIALAPGEIALAAREIALAPGEIALAPGEIALIRSYTRLDASVLKVRCRRYTGDRSHVARIGKCSMWV
jgi:hypothetical protein